MVAFSDELAEWTAAQVTDLDSAMGTAAVLDLDWAGPQPESLEELGELAPLRLTDGASTGNVPHNNFDWLLPRSCTIIGNAPVLIDF